MKDVRIRILTGIILSLAAFISVAGAIAVLVWWLVFTRRRAVLPRLPVLAGSLAVVALVAILLQVLDGTGISYGVRMAAVILVAAWVWSEHRPGEFLHAGVWALGTGRGFELGLVAELAMQALDGLLADLGRLKAAWAMKGVRLTPAQLPAAGTVLVSGAMRRAQDTAELLAIRGYRDGGTLCPAFTTGRRDRAGIAAAAIAAAVAVIPPGGLPGVL